MSDENAITTPESEDASYRADLLNRAAALGISVHHNAKNETIAAKISAALKEDEPEATSSKASLKKTQMELKRVIVTSNDPMKADQTGDILRVSNKVTGNVAFYFPFGKPWHIPNIVLDAVREQKLFLHSARMDGREVVTRTVPAYNIQELPSLTEKELERITAKQAAMRAGG